MKAVIVGLGYVGLPLAIAAAEAGVQVTGLDKNEEIVSGLTVGRSHIDDFTDADIASLVATGFTATTDSAVIAEADIVVICVPTPLNRAGEPDLAAVMAASRDIAANASAGLTVVLESTTYPGTTEEVLQPILEERGFTIGSDLFLAFSPERIDPGNPTFGITNTPKIVGGVTKACGDKAAAFYERFIDTVVRAKGTREAETAKLLENTYRHINIALVNEMAQLCHAMGIDIWDVVDLAKTKPFGFQSFRPSAGVGGHCIPIDPNYLAFKVRAELSRPFQFIELAEEVNSGMPGYVAQRMAALLQAHHSNISGSTVTLLGVTYKPNISDKRESPAVPLAEKLIELGATVKYVDPFVDDWSINGSPIERFASVQDALAESHAAIIVQAHSDFVAAADVLASSRTPLLDATGRFTGEHLERL